MSKILYRADNISVIGEISENILCEPDGSNKKMDYSLNLIFNIHINGKLKSFEKKFNYYTQHISVNETEIQNLNYTKFYDLLSILEDLGYSIKEDRLDGNNYTGNLINDWIKQLS